MSGFGAHEWLMAEGQDQKIASQKSEEKLDHAIYDVREKYSSFLNDAEDLYGFKQRVALVKNDIMKTVDQHLMPVSGVMNKVVASLREDFKKTAIGEGGGWTVTSPDRFKRDLERSRDTDGDYELLDESHSRGRDRGPWNGEGLSADQTRSMGGRDFPHLKTQSHRTACEVKWLEAPGEDPQHREAYPMEDVTLSVEPNGELWCWEVKDGGTSKGSGDALTPDQAQQDAETCFKIEVLKVHEASKRTKTAAGINDAPEVVNEGDFLGYLDDVDQGAEQKIDHNFTGPSHPHNTPSDNFVASRHQAEGFGSGGSFDMNSDPNMVGMGTTPATDATGLGNDMYNTFQEQQQTNGLVQPTTNTFTGSSLPMQVQIYADWCETNRLPKISSKSLELYADNVNQQDLNIIHATLNKIADGKHRKDPDWAQSQSFEPSYKSMEAPDSSIYTVFPNEGANGDWNVEHNSLEGLENGEVGDIYGKPYYDTQAPEGYPEGFGSEEDAMDWAERQGVPQGGGRHRATKLEAFFTRDAELDTLARLTVTAEGDTWADQNDRIREDYFKGREGKDRGMRVRPAPSNAADMAISGWESRQGLEQLPDETSYPSKPNYTPFKDAQRRQSIQDERALLEKADQALTDLLNNRAETFQETLSPIQQALQAVQYAEAVEQQANPMNVMPPAGTVDVMPQQNDPGPPPNLNMPPVGPPPPGTVDPLAGAQGSGDPLIDGLQAASGGPKQGSVRDFFLSSVGDDPMGYHETENDRQKADANQRAFQEREKYDIEDPRRYY